MLVRDYMTKNPVTIEPDDSLARADIIMKAGGFRRLLVVKDGRLFGILSEYDLRCYLESLDSSSSCDGDDASPDYRLSFGNARTCRNPAGAV